MADGKWTFISQQPQFKNILESKSFKMSCLAKMPRRNSGINTDVVEGTDNMENDRGSAFKVELHLNVFIWVAK